MSELSERTVESLWSRLHRGKVVQWGIAYVAAAWGLLQGFAYFSTVFHWPATLQRPVTMAFVVGLPLALVLAWYHGDRGHQRVSGREFAILTALLLIGGVMFWWVGRMPLAPPATTIADAASAAVTQPAAGAKAAGTSIAVLPFVNMSDDKSNEYFSDGISEELLNVLARVDGLGVASRTSSFAYKSSPLGTAAIASALKVNHVLEGSVRKAGRHVRITAQLVDAANDRQLWSETYDRELTDIFVIQEEIANAIVDALQDELGPASATASNVTVRADTKNVKAYELYLKARELFIARKDLAESIRLVEKVTQMDPQFARGWELLAAVSSVAPSWDVKDRDYYAMTQVAARRALELDPGLSMPWGALAIAAGASMPVDWAANFDLLDRAIAADARNSSAFLWRGMNWIYLGFFERALADFDRCLELEPNYPNALRHKALALLWSGKTEQAFDLFERGVAQGFVRSRAENFVGPLVARGNLLAAQLLLQVMGFSPQAGGILIEALRTPGPLRKDHATTIQDYLARPDTAGLRSISASHPFLWLGDFDKVGETDDADSSAFVSWERFPPGYRNSQGFKRKLERQGVLAYWREHGFPPQCHAVGPEDFTCD